MSSVANDVGGLAGAMLLLCPCFGMLAVVGGFMVRGLLVVNSDRLLKDEALAVQAGARMRPVPPSQRAHERGADAVTRRMKASLDCLPLRSICGKMPGERPPPA